MDPLWSPSRKLLEDCLLTKFAGKIGNYQELHQWSIDHREEFWSKLWDFSKVIASHRGASVLEHRSLMPGARWFAQSRLNFAENLLRHCQAHDHTPALHFWCEDKVKLVVTRAELRSQVSACAGALLQAGVVKGDRVAGYLPNGPEAVIAMLATASIGAVWTSASPDFGVQGVIDRFGQIEPKILFGVDGYWYNGKKISCLQKLGEITARLSSLVKTVCVPLIHEAHEFQAWADFLQEPQELHFAQVPFDHPLYIMFSSGTTGVPKCIVHGHGGTLLQHLKEHQLQSDVRPGDVLFYYTTIGWMMWNWMVSGLASGATLMLYDGSPFAAGGHLLFDFADQAHCTHFGVSAKFIDSAAKQNFIPRQTHDLSSIRVLFSTGSPLVPEGFDYVYESIKPDVQLCSISGGTDIISCFVLGNPWSPVYRGEIQAAGLGMDVQVFDDEGKATSGKGELVCASPFPSMPIGFWKDEQAKKYTKAYFTRFPGLWCHGDYVQKTENGGFIIFGRSDAVLNPGGVRIGTAEIYRQVEKFPEVIESVVIGQDWQNDIRVILFVKLREGATLDESLQEKIRSSIRTNTTPRHVPAKILTVRDIPRTKSGKIVELAVRKIVHNEQVQNVEALANPEALEHFRNRRELQ